MYSRKTNVSGLMVLGAVLLVACAARDGRAADGEQASAQQTSATGDASSAQPQGAGDGQVEIGPEKEEKKPAGPLAEGKLFDGKTLGAWKPTEFVGKGDVAVKDGAIVMEMGHDLTGITWSGEVIRQNYEIQLEAKRIEGNDFFCALTFPVGKDPCSFVVGGWGGSLVGLSSLDGFDAANNETTGFKEFKKDQWYKIKVSVTPEKIEAWIDNDQMVEVEIKDRRIGIRWEVEQSVPLGVATYQTKGAVRNIYVWRK